jgi:hypothetical protein
MNALTSQAASQGNARKGVYAKPAVPERPMMRSAGGRTVTERRLE